MTEYEEKFAIEFEPLDDARLDELQSAAGRAAKDLDNYGFAPSCGTQPTGPGRVVAWWTRRQLAARDHRVEQTVAAIRRDVRVYGSGTWVWESLKWERPDILVLRLVRWSTLLATRPT